MSRKSYSKYHVSKLDQLFKAWGLLRLRLCATLLIQSFCCLVVGGGVAFLAFGGISRAAWLVGGGKGAAGTQQADAGNLAGHLAGPVVPLILSVVARFCFWLFGLGFSLHIYTWAQEVKLFLSLVFG